MGSTLKKIAVIGESIIPLALDGYANRLWTVEKLRAVLAGLEDRDQCEVIALLRAVDKNFWAHRIVDAGWHLLATHPIAPNAEKAYKLTTSGQPIQMFYEYFRLATELASGLMMIGPLLFFSAKICVVDTLAMQQALLEFFDVIRTFLPAPIDEIYARTRNLRGDQAEPDLITAYLRMKNGCEGQVESHCLAAQKSLISVEFYGRDGQFCWDGAAGDRGGVIGDHSSFSEVVKSYQIVDWIERSGRFDRAITFREAIK